MTYRALPSSLYETADAAVDFFKSDFGLRGFRIEEAIHAEVAYRPTLSIESREHEIICIEVSDTAYAKSLDQFVLDCKNLTLPVKLYVAMPRGTTDPAYQANTTRARASGVGVLEVDARGGTIVFEALSLSLTGCRRIEKHEFPARYRQALVRAEQTFRQGSPVKGCSLLYDQIELLTRATADRALRRDAWTKAKPAGHVPAINVNTGAWHDVIVAAIKHCDFRKIGCPKLTTDLLTRVLGIVGYRNDAGHEPRKLSERIKRDTQLRTRFETALDILQDLVDASRSLRL